MRNLKRLKKDSLVDTHCSEGTWKVREFTMTDFTERARQILEWWEVAHFKLSEKQQADFLSHGFISNLCKLEPQAVKEAISLNKISKLKDIYLVASALQNTKYPSQNILTAKATKFPLVKNRIKRGEMRNSKDSTSRGQESFRAHSMINPPPMQSLNVDRSKYPKCSICGKAIVGVICGCWD